MKKAIIQFIIFISIVFVISFGASTLTKWAVKDIEEYNYNQGYLDGKAVWEESFNNIHHRYQEVLSTCDYMCDNCVEDNNQECITQVCMDINEEADFYNAW